MNVSNIIILKENSNSDDKFVASIKIYGLLSGLNVFKANFICSISISMDSK